MKNEATVTDVLEAVKGYQRDRRCPRCDGSVSIRGIGGDHWWTCMDCDAAGLGYTTRSDVIEDLRGKAH